MTEIKLDFSKYLINNESFYRVESDEKMIHPFGGGYATIDFSEFLNYTVGLKLNQSELLLVINKIDIFYRISNKFSEIEKNIIQGIMKIEVPGKFERDLAQKVIKSFNENHVLVETQTEEDKKKLDIVFPENYFLSSGPYRF